MPNTKSERKAIEYIERYLPNLCKKGKFVLADDFKDENNKSPDLQNEADNIGIEHTIAEDQEYLKMEGIMSARNVDGTHKYSNEKFLENINSGYEPIVVGSGRAICKELSSPEFDYSKLKIPFEIALNKKLKKLNTTTNRKSFDKNGIIIMNSMPLNNNERIEDLYDFIKEVQNKYKKDNPNDLLFDFVIVSAQEFHHILCYFDMNDVKKCENHEIID